MFRTSLCPSSGATTTAVAASSLPSELDDSSAVGRGLACRPDHDQQHCYHHAPTVKPEAATAVVELLMMGVRTSETCWAVHKRQVINLRNCCIQLVDLFEFISLKFDILEFHALYPFLYQINIPQSHSTNIKKFYFYIQIDT